MINMRNRKKDKKQEEKIKGKIKGKMDGGWLTVEKRKVEKMG